MRRAGKLLLLLLILAGAGTLSAEVRDLEVFKEGFNDFITGISDALPYNSTVGLNWADAYIGNFPHFGVGITAGATALPFSAVSKATDALGVSLASQFPQFEEWGFPLPAAVIDARLGGFVIPFDIGFKIGFIPDFARQYIPPQFSVDYLLIGGDIRIALVQEKEGAFIPDISIGGGYNYMRGSVSVSGLLGSDEEIANIAGYDITLQDPSLTLNWEASVIDLKVQISKDILLITPFLGGGVAYGIATAGGGLTSDVLVNGEPITIEQIREIESYYQMLGQSAPDLSRNGILISSQIEGWSWRAFGGLSLNLLILRLDVCAMYNFTSRSYGLTANVRLQF